jgi:ribonuclease HII
MAAQDIDKRPHYKHERAWRKKRGHHAIVCGIDEVGRGPLAGPVVAAAAVLDEMSAAALQKRGVKDSKSLSKKRLEEIAALLRCWRGPGRVIFALGAASVHEIESVNIRLATHRAMLRAFDRLPVQPDIALVDGKETPAELAIDAEPLIKGDSRSLSIAAAAIYAKSARDGLMRALAKRWPAYGWETNMGYGSAAHHRAAILENGLTPHHRTSFCAKLLSERKRRVFRDVPINENPLA